MATAPILFNGSDLLFYIGSGSTATPIAMSTSCSLSIASTSVDTTTKDSVGGWAETLMLGRSWSGTVDGLVVWGSNVTVFTDALFNRVPLDIKLQRRDGVAGDIIFEGTAWIESFDMTAGKDEAVSYSVKITGNGALTKTVKA